MNQRFKQPDSLEMLLDTMCNAFGGIILIALLVSLISREVQRTEAQTHSALDDSEMSDRRIARAEADLEDAIAYQQELEQRRTDPVQAERLRLVERREALRRKIEASRELELSGNQDLERREGASAAQLQERFRALVSEHQEVHREWVSERNRYETAMAAQAALQQRIEQTESGLRSATERQTRRLRLPREHDTSRKPWHVIVRHGHLYPVHLFVGGSKERNTMSIDWRTDVDGNEVVIPRPAGGLDPATAGAAVGNLFAALSPDEYYLVFHVYADSFAAFIQAREAPLRQGFEMTWVPLENSVHLIMRPWSDEPPPRPL